MRKAVLILFLFCAATCLAVWAAVRFTDLNRNRLFHAVTDPPGVATVTPADAWTRAVEKVKEDRGADAGGASETPPELKHYSERYWFLATQVAEIEKHNIHTCQDFLDLAAMIQRGEMVSVPFVTDSYVLFGIGQKADDDVFFGFEDGQNFRLYDEAELKDAYTQIALRRKSLQSDITALNAQAGRLNKRERAKRSELQKQISEKQEDLKSVDEYKTALDESYGQPAKRQKLLHDSESLQLLAKNFGGRSYDLDNPDDRKSLKINMLSSLRPEALKILEEVASAYHRQFDRPLPVSSLVRPEQYQHALRRVNRNAVLIDSPPHSTGLAFDIDYRYMGGAEQTYLMDVLASLKRAGRIEVIRERNANYHVFAFINGVKPPDDLIAASLEKAGAPPPETHHAEAKPANPKAKSRSVKARRPRSTVRKRRR